MYQVMIVEDDPMVATINRQYVDMNPSFRVCGSFRNGKDGLEFIKKKHVDLVILDYYMPLMNGMEFMERLKQFEKKPDVIIVTAANEMETVKGLIGAGVIDYLVKPFEYARFERALDQFSKKQELLSNVDGNLSQRDIDRLLSSGAVNEAGPTRMQKGLQEHTLETIRQYMKEHRDQSFTSEEIAEQVHLSRVTIRRYVNYMLETHEIVSGIDYKTGGRPSIQFRYVGFE